MSLIICPECGKEVSDKATACVHCGYPIKEHIEASCSQGSDDQSASNQSDDKDPIINNRYNYAHELLQLDGFYNSLESHEKIYVDDVIDMAEFPPTEDIHELSPDEIDDVNKAVNYIIDSISYCFKYSSFYENILKISEETCNRLKDETLQTISTLELAYSWSLCCLLCRFTDYDIIGYFVSWMRLFLIKTGETREVREQFCRHFSLHLSYASRFADTEMSRCSIEESDKEEFLMLHDIISGYEASGSQHISDRVGKRSTGAYVKEFMISFDESNIADSNVQTLYKRAYDFIKSKEYASYPIRSRERKSNNEPKSTIDEKQEKGKSKTGIIICVVIFSIVLGLIYYVYSQKNIYAGTYYYSSCEVTDLDGNPVDTEEDYSGFNDSYFQLDSSGYAEVYIADECASGTWSTTSDDVPDGFIGVNLDTEGDDLAEALEFALIDTNTDSLLFGFEYNDLYYMFYFE